ncbi:MULTISPECIES: DUF465 domain-containing protein [Asticcacaulis]|jgi:hypothetical protein|uniref:DUF465 domain-containing protein n=1 Tax=Asticcacaulis endophyticus TaxID=1395890 RepID=A0A918UU87_9CAUL|nr:MULTISPECIES: DUF465 domain-containing protein [Asticcacaulis]WAC48135.1 DUF465 domain-containing protein [Asticcacaulis sp. SL142]WKL57467.1 DUF465 domain-containing protein [Asticcacaulis sp. ZE23SCel15]GGZ34310.1 hypothetical protein GCM10011273_20920 [Asticcacaulis endophyticus]
MTIAARVRELDQRHQSLKHTIEREAKNPSVDSLYLKELKRKKLKLKEEIERIRDVMRQGDGMKVLQ